MHIDRVTITGVDDRTDVDSLLRLQERYPFVEWGILFSADRTGQAKYPTRDFAASLGYKGLKLSAHFCGQYSREPIQDGIYYQVQKALEDGYQRIQLNINFSDTARFQEETFLTFLSDESRGSIILQYNKANSLIVNGLLKDYSFYDSLHVLYDASGGNGVEIKEIEAPFNVYTGYSGGIGLENINKICTMIIAHPAEDKVWIDMETKVRDVNNRLDLVQVEKVLQECVKYIQQ